MKVGSYRGKHLCAWNGVDCEGLGVHKDGTHLTCLTNPWDYNGDARDREVVVHVDGFGDSLANPKVRLLSVYAACLLTNGDGDGDDGAVA